MLHTKTIFLSKSVNPRPTMGILNLYEEKLAYMPYSFFILNTEDRNSCHIIKESQQQQLNDAYIKGYYGQ